MTWDTFVIFEKKIACVARLQNLILAGEKKKNVETDKQHTSGWAAHRTKHQQHCGWLKSSLCSLYCCSLYFFFVFLEIWKILNDWCNGCDAWIYVFCIFVRPQSDLIHNMELTQFNEFTRLEFLAFKIVSYTISPKLEITA